MIIFYKRSKNKEVEVGYYNGSVHANDETLIKMVQLALRCDIYKKVGNRKIKVHGDDQIWNVLKHKIHSPYYLKRGTTHQHFKYSEGVIR